LEYLKYFGQEPISYAARLKPILTRFVSTFDSPDSADTLSFWNSITIAQATNLCGAPPYYLSGWITGFFHWDTNGKAYGQDASGGTYALDNVTYPRLGIYSLPVGYAKAPFKMLDYPEDGKNTSAYVIAGALGRQIISGPPQGYTDALKRLGNQTLAADVNSTAHTTLKPLSAWLLFAPVDLNATREERTNDELYNITKVLRQTYTAQQCSLPSVNGQSEDEWAF
jgi:hypothetical protein